MYIYMCVCVCARVCVCVCVCVVVYVCVCYINSNQRVCVCVCVCEVVYVCVLHKFKSTCVWVRVWLAYFGLFEAKALTLTHNHLTNMKNLLGRNALAYFSSSPVTKKSFKWKNVNLKRPEIISKK